MLQRNVWQSLFVLPALFRRKWLGFFSLVHIFIENILLFSFFFFVLVGWFCLVFCGFLVGCLAFKGGSNSSVVPLFSVHIGEK